MRTPVVILGAGFGGLELSTRLSEELADKVQVTLIDQPAPRRLLGAIATTSTLGEKSASLTNYSQLMLQEIGKYLAPSQPPL